MENLFSIGDGLGPLKVIHVHEASLGLSAVLVVDNVAMGPSIGGIRMAPDVTVEECFRLARAMTFKNSAAGLPHGGGKIVIRGDPKMDKGRKQTLLRALASALRNETSYIFAPDMGTDEECMAWIRDEVERVVALPRELGGIPLDEIGATGWGLSHAVEVALTYCDFPLEGARFVAQGFGAVGRNVCRFLAARGAVLVAVAALLALKEEGRPVTDYAGGASLGRDEVIGVECDIWIPAARPDVIHDDNVTQLNTRLVVEGANIPLTLAAEQYLHDKGILCVPDFIANAGGVICAAMEYHGAGESAALLSIEEKVRRNTEQVLRMSRKEKITPREAAQRLALERVEKAMSYRRFSSFSMGPNWI